MKRKNTNARKPQSQQPKPQPSAAKKRLRAYPWMPVLVGFVALWLLLSWVYGDVMWRIEQNSYVSVNTMQMKPLTDQSLGVLLYASRWLIALWRYPWLGGLVTALMLTDAMKLFADTFHLKQAVRWVFYALPYIYFGWLVWRGFNAYFRAEPAWFALVPAILCVLASAFHAVGSLIGKGAEKPASNRRAMVFAAAGVLFLAGAVCVAVYLPLMVSPWVILCWLAFVYMIAVWLCTPSQPEEGRPAITWWVTLVIAVLGLALGIGASKMNDSVIATAKMQRQLEEQDWEGMCQTALSVDRPTRSVAGYYALALEQQDALLEGLWDLPFNFPKVTFDDEDSGDEYAMFGPDCNLAAGLANSAYHEAFEQTVIGGQRLHWMKTMCKAALVNKEWRLVRKYLDIISMNPFEGKFCERIAPMIGKDDLSEDAEFAHIQELAPRDKHPFEQNFRKPVFLGYNMGLAEGPDKVLRTSAASCLYSKDLDAFIPRAQIFVAKGWPLPECMQQALVIYSIKHGGADFLKQFPGISPMTEQTIAAFSREVAPIMKDKEAMRNNLKKDWLGSYVYYYYCENNNPEQVRKRESAGVN